MSSLYWYHGTETVVGDITTVSLTNIVTKYTPHQMVVKALLNTFLGHYRIWCILLFQLSVCHAKPHVWQSSKHLKKMAEKIKKKYKIFFQFLQKETICMRKKQAAMAVVVAEWVRNGKISARHILRFKDKNLHFLIHFIDPMLFRAVQFNIFWMILILACSEPNGMHFLKIVPFLDFSLLCAWMR